MMQKRVIIFGLLLYITGLQAAYSIDWKMIEPDVYYDVDSIKKVESGFSSQKHDNLYSYLLMDKKGGHKYLGADFGYGVFNQIINCDTKQTTIASFLIVDKSDNLISKKFFSENELIWNSFPENSREMYLYNLCCKQVNTTTQKGFVTPTQVYDNAVKSAVYIETKDKNGELLGTGSGVVVLDDGTIVTCFHVVANADVIEVKFNDGSTYKVNGFRYINPLEDIAVLTLATTQNFTPIKINNINDTKIGEKIYALANPQGFQFTFTDGMINQQKDSLILFSAPASPGSSGGALLNEQGDLVGIIASSWVEQDTQNINFAIQNKVFVSKLQNYPIKNLSNLGWTDFLVSKADSKQLKIYASNAMYQENYALAYKALLPFTKRVDFPKDKYALMGLTAIYAGFLSDIANVDQYCKEAIEWFEKSLDAGYNIETSAYALAALTPPMIKEESLRTKLIKKGVTTLYNNNNYTESQNKIKDLGNAVEKCKGEFDCLIPEMINNIVYTGKLYQKEMGEKLENYEWFYKMEK